MKERPILFSVPMVRALLNGSKTQTRRAVKFNDRLGCWDADGFYQVQPDTIAKMPWTEHSIRWNIACPYGQPGDRLWVREAWAVHPIFDKRAPRDIDAPVTYAADNTKASILVGKGRPSIFMPHWASRITLEITAVRVDRLQDISEADAIAEGCTTSGEIGPDGIAAANNSRGAYIALWQDINGPASWDLNPWVWVIEFKRITP